MSGARFAAAVVVALAFALAPEPAVASNPPPAAPAPARPAARSVEVELLAQLSPRTLDVAGGGRRLALAARGDALLVNGRTAAAPLALPPGIWRLAPAGAPARTYVATLAVRAQAGILRVRATMALENYVAAVVASETLPATPREALRAQAVVVRSYALAARDRHAGGSLCDLAHCQLLRGQGIPPRHRAAAREAARKTSGKVLVLPSGAVALGAFHAACGGHTADPAEAFGGEGTGAAAVPDSGCPREEWRARVDGAELAAAIRGALASGAPGEAASVPARLGASSIAVVPGRGGWVAHVADPGGRWRLGGDAFARAADAAVGRGQVRSARFTLAPAGGGAILRGTGRGHGVGLCQAGAARRAAAGAGYREILGWYFPGARVAHPDASRALQAP